MEEKFCFLNLDNLKKDEEDYRKSLSIRKIMYELIVELEKLGHRKINCKIKDYTEQFLKERDIAFSYIYYQNLDSKYGDEKYYNKTLIINFNDYFGNCNTIDILRGFEHKPQGGYYDEIFKINNCFKKENIDKQEDKMKKEFLNAYTHLEEYNKKLKELVELRDSFGYLAK